MSRLGQLLRPPRIQLGLVEYYDIRDTLYAWFSLRTILMREIPGAWDGTCRKKYDQFQRNPYQ